MARSRRTPRPPAPQAPKQRTTGRKPLSRRQRLVFAITLGLAILVAVVVGVLLATGSSDTAPRAVTIPAADRDAPAALIEAAQAVGYRPPSTSGLGSIETAPAVAAQPPANDRLLPVGTTAPDWTLKTPAGESISLQSLRGKTVLLEFFATWCPHCAAESPHLADLYRSLPKSKYAFVSINADNEDAPTVYAYHVYFGLPFPAVLDPDPGSDPVSYPNHGAAGPTSTAYRAFYYPTFYVIDPQGRISWRSDGEQPNALLRQELNRAAGA